jgi:hypothetical protein
MGYGMPNLNRALYSTDQRTLLVAEDQLDDGYYHVYELDVPREFVNLTTNRCIRVTLAYDPPVKGTRKDYVRRRLYFRLLRDQTEDSIMAAAKAGRDLQQPPKLLPTCESIRGSTVQSTVFTGKAPHVFGSRSDDDVAATWHILVRSEPRFDTENLPPQRYALVASLEHTDAELKLYQKVRQRVEARQRAHWG